MEIKFDKVSLVINPYTPLEKTILSSVSFEIKESGIYSFIGKSNSGKTAVGDLINALIFPTAGKVYVGNFINDGRRIKNINRLRIEIGYVFKNPYDMFIGSTVKKEIEFGMLYFKYKLKEKNYRAKDALRLVNLDESYLHMDPRILNIRDARKVALASALIFNPEILILDEPTIGLNNKDKSELQIILKILKNRYNKKIIILSKDTNFCYSISDHIYIMNKTRILTHGDKYILKDEALLKSLGLEIPGIVKFINEANRQGHKINDYVNLLDLIKGVYRDAK